MRQRILTAAASVLRERGFAETTTKEIARAAGISEGSIYNHFASKTDLIAATMGEIAGGVREAMARLQGQVGKRTLEDNLAELAEAQIGFFLDLLPITGPTLGDRELRAWLRDGGPDPDSAAPRGPVLGHAGLIAYLDAEQGAGRLAADAKPAYVAAALIGACQQYAFLSLLTRPEVIATLARLPGDASEYAHDVVRTILSNQVGDS